MIDATQVNTPGWWLARLGKRLGDQRDRYTRLDLYFRNEAGIPQLATKTVKQSYQRLMEMSRTNFAELVVEAVRERMNINGFRTGADSDDLGDAEAWRIWQANALDADSSLVHRAQLSLADAYVMVGANNDDPATPIITPEDPREVITQHDPRQRRKIVAALKVFHDDLAGVDRAFLFFPGRVYKAFRARDSGDQYNEMLADWTWEVGTPERLPTGIVPVVKFANRADMSGCGLGEFEPHIPVLDRINFSVLSRLEIATLQAFRQRGIKGVPRKDNQGNEINYDDIFSADPGAMWQLPDTAEIWESGLVDLRPILDSIRADVQDLAAVSRTPLFYLTPDANNGSAEGASLAREGLVFKTADRLVQTGESWEQVMSLAFTFAGDDARASRRDMEIIWASPERFSLAERYDAASKAQAAGVPWRSVMQNILQFSPQEIDRMEAERASDALLTQTLVAPPAPPVPPNVPPPVTGANG